MPNLLNTNYGWKSNSQRPEKVNKYGIPIACEYAYSYLLNEFIAHYKDLIKEIIDQNGGAIILPMKIEWLVDYLSGYKLDYIGFPSQVKGFEGYWSFADDNRETVNVYYNQNVPKARQNFTKIHETFHLMQFLDLEFRNCINSLFNNSVLPEKIIVKLIERSADKATVMFMMPNDYVIKKYRELQDIDKVANLFGVCRKTMNIRLIECGLLT